MLVSEDFKSYVVGSGIVFLNFIIWYCLFFFLESSVIVVQVLGTGSVTCKLMINHCKSPELASIQCKYIC